MGAEEETPPVVLPSLNVERSPVSRYPKNKISHSTSLSFCLVLSNHMDWPGFLHLARCMWKVLPINLDFAPNTGGGVFFYSTLSAVNLSRGMEGN